MKRALRVILIVAIILVVTGFALRWYISSTYVIEMVQTRLQKLYGGKVKFTNVDVGVGSSELSGFELFEKESQDDDAPWLTVEKVETDLSILSVLRGEEMPNRIRIQGAVVTLRFDEQGRLLTTFPGNPETEPKSGLPKVEGEVPATPLPNVTVENSTIKIRKAGAAELLIHKVNGRLQPQEGKAAISGTLENEKWGKWNLSGAVTDENDQVAVELKSVEPVAVTQAMLDQIPFVPASIWREVQFSKGRTEAVVHLRKDLAKADGPIHYRVELNPSSTNFHIRALKMDATEARGKVTIEDGLVKLRDVEASAFGGGVATSGDLDFRGAVTQFAFAAIRADQVQVERFPPSWKFPKQISGKLVGSAALAVTIDEKGEIQTKGDGKGKIVDASVAGQPAAEPITLELQPVPGGFRFGSVEKPSKGAMDLHLHPLALTLAALALNAVQDQPPAQPEPAPDPKPAEKKSESSYLDINLKMKDVDLAKFIAELDVRLPAPLAGKLSFEMKVGIPLDESRDLKKYRLRGNAQLTDFSLGELRLHKVEAEVVYENGVLRMPVLKGEVPSDQPGEAPGRITGSGSLQVEPLGDLAVEVVLERIPLAPVAAFSGLAEPLQGRVSGSMNANVPIRSAASLEGWTATAKLNSEHITTYGLNLKSVSAQARLQKGQLQITGLRGDLNGAPLTAKGTLALTSPFPFTVNLDAQQVPAASLNRFAPAAGFPAAASGTLAVDAAVKGTLAPLQVLANGTARASQLRIQKVVVGDARFAWNLSDETFAIKDLKATLYDGEISGTAVVPLRPAQAGAIDLKMKNIDAGALLKDLSGPALMVAGAIDGTVKGIIPAAKANAARPVKLDVKVAAPKLRVQNIPTEELQASVVVADGTVAYRVVAKSLGGVIELDGKIPPVKVDQPDQEGRLRIDSIQLDRLLRALNMEQAASSFRGRIILDATYRHDEDGWPVGTGRLRIAGLRYQDKLIAANMVGDLILTDGQVRLRELTTTVGNGVARAQFAYDLSGGERSWFTVALDDVEADYVLGPWLNEMIEGPLQARIRGRLGPTLSGTADIVLSRGKVLGVEVTQWRVPLEFRFAPSTGRGEIQIHESTAQAGRGRVSGKMRLAWDFTVQTDGQLRFSRVDLPTLLRQVGGPTQLAVGSVSGRFDFGGQAMRSLDDLQGTLVVQMEQAQAFRMPVLDEVSRYAGIGPSTTFQKGQLTARLNRGLFRIAGFELESGNLQVFIEGTVALSGRLNLDVLADTGTVGLDPRLRLLGLRLPVAGPVPLALLQEAAALLSNRVVHLRVTGTLRDPNVRVLPLATVSQAALRYLLNRQVGPLPFNP